MQTSFYMREPLQSEDTQVTDHLAADIPSADIAPHVMTCQTKGKANKSPDPDTEEHYVSMSKRQLRHHNQDHYPFLEKDDPKLDRNPYEILRQEINLSDNCSLPSDRVPELMDILEGHIAAFSLYGELGQPDHVIDFNLTNKEAKFIRPYTISIEDRAAIDLEMTRLQLLGVIKEGLSSFSSPVMLIARNGHHSRKRCVLDLRVLNLRLEKRSYAFPLIEDCLQQIGYANSQFLSALDITDAIFGIGLGKESQKYAGISTYSGGKSYYFQKIPKGLSLSPAVFSKYILKILSEIPGHQDWLINYFDDILIHSQSLEDHMDHIYQVLEVLAKHRLKINPTKAKLFKNSIEYLGYTILIENRQPRISIQHSKIDAIRRLKRPHNLKTARGFCGATSYLSRFLPKLSELLQPIKKLTRKNSIFHWTEECNKRFLEIKELITKAPVLHLPSKDDIFRLYIDTSREATGCTITQVPTKDSQDEKLIGFYSRNLPESAKAYSVSELEASGILICLSALKCLKNRFIQIFTDHSALVHIMKSDKECPTLRLKKFVEQMSGYHYELAYKKGTEMVICDFLSRAKYIEDEEMTDTTPIALRSQVETSQYTGAVTRSQTHTTPEQVSLDTDRSQNKARQSERANP